MRLLLLALMLMLTSCQQDSRSVTGRMWAADAEPSYVIIEEANLTDDGRKRLDEEPVATVIHDIPGKRYLIRVSEGHDWGLVTLKVLATPVTIGLDGVRITAVAIVQNPELTRAVIEAILKR